MVNAFVYTLLCGTGISLMAFAGALTLFMKKNNLQNIVMLLVSLSTGALLGGAFFHLIPESLEIITLNRAFSFVAGGFLLFFIVEKVFEWRHCHKVGECSIHSFGYMNLFGDAVHNFLDGIVLAAAFLVDTGLGFTTAIAIGLHEIPQEVGDYGVLIHSGFDRVRALFLNFGVAITIILGGFTGYFLDSIIANYIVYALPIAAGGFIYIAASDLTPELRKEKIIFKWLINLTVVILGFLMMYFIKFID